MITPSNFARSIELEAAMRAKYGLVYNRWQPEYTKLYDVEKSNRMYEEHHSTAGFGLVPEKAIGVGVTYNDPKEGFLGRIEQTTYGLGYIVAYEMFLWQQDNRINMMPAALAESVIQTIETLGILPFDRAFNSSYTGADGKEMCATDHPREDGGGTYANEPTTASDLNRDSIEQLMIDLGNYTDPAGLKINPKVKRIMHGTSLFRQSFEMFGSPQDPETANNTKNFTYNLYNWMMSHYLTSTVAWFAILEGTNGLVNYVTRKHDFTKDNEFSSENALFKAVFTMAFGFRDPRRIYGSPGAGN
jgi:hypothetical protein